MFVEHRLQAYICNMYTWLGKFCGRLKLKPEACSRCLFSTTLKQSPDICGSVLWPIKQWRTCCRSSSWQKRRISWEHARFKTTSKVLSPNSSLWTKVKVFSKSCELVLRYAKCNPLHVRKCIFCKRCLVRAFSRASTPSLFPPLFLRRISSWSNQLCKRRQIWRQFSSILATKPAAISQSTEITSLNSHYEMCLLSQTWSIPPSFAVCTRCWFRDLHWAMFDEPKSHSGIELCSPCF